MKLKNLLPLLAIVCSFAACSLDENGGNGGNGNDGPLFKEPCVQWGASKSTVKSYMKGYTIVDDEDEDYLSYMDIKTRNLLPYTVMYDYDFDIEYVYNQETMTGGEVNKGLWCSTVYVMGTTKQQQENLNEEIIAFFKENYNEVPFSPEDWEEDTDYGDEEEDMETEIIGTYVNDEKTIYVVVGLIKDLNNCIAASYSYEF